MRAWKSSVLLLLLVSAALAQMPAAVCTPVAKEDGIGAFFSPHGHCTDAIVEQINKAAKTIRVQAYSFTSAPIAQALIDAHKRGVDITVVLDASQRSDKYSSATFLLNQGIATYIDPNHAIAHNKIMLIDGRTIVTGSFNFSKAAEESNAENLLIIEDKLQLFSAYDKNFNEHLAHPAKYEGKAEVGNPGPAANPASATSQPDPTQDEAKVIVYVTKSGKKYHRDGCRYLKSRIPITLEEAKAKGYTPCSACSPP